jgi:2,5-dioxopentanoate dehydrogenase
MSLQPVLIAGEWGPSRSQEGSFNAVDPSTRSKLPEQYPVSGWDEVEVALRAGARAVEQLRSVSPDTIAGFLEDFADRIESQREELVDLAYHETGLPKEPRLNSVELPRTTDQLRQAARAARERSWTRPTIDTKNNIRSMFRPLSGPVVVFGPNNFPFAFNSSAGGDFAAAIASGNPVIAKANPGHPGTTKLLTELAFDAARAAGLPPAMVQLIYRTSPQSGLKMVSHPLVGATAFTGSRSAGLKLKEAADRAGKPVYLEMSSINPVFVLPGALDERLDALASEFGTSCLMGAGQFCTNPGMVVLLQSDESEAFLQAARANLEAAPPGVLLTAQSPGYIAESIEILQEHGAQVVTGGQEVTDGGYRFQNTLLRVTGDQFIDNPEPLQTEAFGSVSLFVFARDEGQLLEIASHLEGNLTGSVYSHTGGQDDLLYDRLEPVLRAKVGRLLNDKMPTGVAVSPAMVHGGPYPSTGHAGFTAVGIPAALERFGALQSYDNVRHHRLPPELQNKNPTGQTWRYVDGEWSQRDIEG